MKGKPLLSPASPTLLRHARSMRREMTEPERRLWFALRRQALGTKVRRQVPVGPFIADFYVPSARLVVEVDGATHEDAAADATRDAWFASRGVLVLRVTNQDVMRNPEGVLTRIGVLVSERVAPPPQPSPARGEGVGAR